MNLDHATEISSRIVLSLSPYCDRIHIAGSIRRKKPDVKDIEIVCQPRRERGDLFGGTEMYTMSFGFAVMALIKGDISKMIKGYNTRNPMPRYVQLALPEGINLDLFMPSPHDYFRQLAIRTGSASYSQHIIAKAWRRLGWVGTEHGLRLEKECDGKERDGKIKWTCLIKNPTLPPAWESEEDFFAWLKVPFVSPEDRSMHFNT